MAAGWGAYYKSISELLRRRRLLTAAALVLLAIILVGALTASGLQRRWIWIAAGLTCVMGFPAALLQFRHAGLAALVVLASLCGFLGSLVIVPGQPLAAALTLGVCFVAAIVAGSEIVASVGESKSLR